MGSRVYRCEPAVRQSTGAIYPITRAANGRQMNAPSHNDRLGSWPPEKKPTKLKITPAKKSLRAKIQNALLRSVRTNFRRGRKAQKRRRELLKLKLRRARNRAARLEELHREITPGLFVGA